MSRLSYDGLLLQAQLGAGDMLHIEEIAKTIFNGGAKTISTTALARALHASKNLISMGRAIAVPNRKDMKYVQSTANNAGVQCEAVVNLATRQSYERRRAEIHEQTQNEIAAFLKCKEDREPAR